MGCFVLLFALISPRLAILFTWIFSDVLERAYDDWWLPFLGFFLLPWTTLAYAWMWMSGTNQVAGFEWFIVAVAFLADLSALFGGSRSAMSR